MEDVLFCTEDSFGIKNMCTIWIWLLSPNHFFSNCHFRQGIDNQGSKGESDKSQLNIDFSNSQNNKQQHTQESVFHNEAQGGPMRDLEPQKQRETVYTCYLTSNKVISQETLLLSHVNDTDPSRLTELNDFLCCADREVKTLNGS